MVRRASIVAVVSLALAALFAGSAAATFPGKPGRIAYDSDGFVWTVAADGHGGRTRIGEGTFPSFSPDGGLIVYVKGGHELVVARSDGSGVRSAYVDKAIGEPCFGADGKTLFFVKDTSGEGYSDIWSVPLAGGEARRLTHTGSRTSEIDTGAPEAAANGRFVVYSKNGAVWTMRPNGTRQRELARGSTPTVSPDSREVAFTRNGELFLIGAGGGGERAVEPFHTEQQPEELDRGVGFPAFSPDGRQIALTYKRTTDAGPSLHEAKRLAVYSLRSHKLRILTGPVGGGLHAAWQSLP